MAGIGGWMRRRREPERRGAHRRGQAPRPGRDDPTAPPAPQVSAPEPPATPLAAPVPVQAPAPAFQAHLTIDALGRKCPIPIIMLAQRLHEVPVGGIIAVLADDPAAQPDVPSWCRMKSQDFVREVPLDRGWAFLIRRCY